MIKEISSIFAYSHSFSSDLFVQIRKSKVFMQYGLQEFLCNPLRASLKNHLQVLFKGQCVYIYIDKIIKIIIKNEYLMFNMDSKWN